MCNLIGNRPQSATFHTANRYKPFKKTNMKQLTVLIGLFISMTFNCHAQSQTERIAKEICDKLNDVNLDQSSEFSNNKSIEIIQSTYLRNQESIKKLISEYSKTYTNKSNIEIAKLVGRDITFYLMKNCNVYQRITMFKNKPVPNISTTTEKVGEDFTELLIVKTKTNNISQSLVDECMIKAMDKNEKELVRNFGSKFSLAFTREFQAYLMTKCEPYMTWTASLLN